MNEPLLIEAVKADMSNKQHGFDGGNQDVPFNDTTSLIAILQLRAIQYRVSVF
ncbi:MAG: hypothetical protein ACXWT1_22575 [Methylobacter sp.]|jgi:hypothetical protein